MSGIISKASTDFCALGTPLPVPAAQSAGAARPSPFDDNLLQEIKHVGFHLFIRVRIGEPT